MGNLFFAESTMEDSFIYQSFNSSNNVVERLVKYIKTGVALDSSYIEEQYSQIKKTMISPLASRVLESYDNGDIQLLYSREVKVGVSIPFIIRKSETGKPIATIFISTFSTIDKSDNLSIPVKQLYALMESAYVALQMQINPMKVQRNTGIMNVCSSIYVQMFMRILNKEYALTLDPVLYDKVSYCLTKFFLERVWEYPNSGLIDAYASNNLENISQLDLDLTKTGYDGSNITDINELLQFIRGLSPRMNNLNTRYFIERYLNTYHGSSIMSMDYLPYLFFVIINVILGSFLISQVALNDIVKNTKGINSFYVELSKII